MPRLQVVSDRAKGVERRGVLPAGTTGPDGLAYMADLILQLRGMADDLGYPALGGILEVAYQEARFQEGHGSGR